MAKDYLHLRSLVFDNPLVIAGTKLDDILWVLSDRLHIQAPVLAPTTGEPVGLRGIEVDNRLSVVQVHGTLVNRGGIDALSGLTSYESIRVRVERAIESESDAIVLDVDSMGGEAAGNFDLANFIRDARVRKPIFAVVNTNALSGGYSIASAAEKVFATSDSLIGSIGIKILHEDRSDQDKKKGRKITELFRGDRKIDMSPHQALSAEAQAFIDRLLDVGYADFVSVIANNRGMSEQAVIETQAATYLGIDAVEAGLVDEVMPAEEAIETIKSLTLPRRAIMTEVTATAELEEIKAKATANELAKAKSDKVEFEKAQEVDRAAALVTAAADARTVAAKITQACTVMGSPEMAPELIRAGLSVSEAKAKLFDSIAGGQAKINTKVDDATNAGEPNEGTALLCAAMKNIK